MILVTFQTRKIANNKKLLPFREKTYKLFAGIE